VKVRLELLGEDDAGDSKQGTQAAQKLVDSKVYADAGVPQISPSSANPKFTRNGYKTTFRVVADDVLLGGTLGLYAAKDLKGQAIAIVDDRIAYSYDAVGVLVAAMVKAGSADPAKYLPVLAKTEGYKGVTGNISFDAKGDIKNGALTLYTYKGGNRESLAVVR